jgi:hypothetical protein
MSKDENEERRSNPLDGHCGKTGASKNQGNRNPKKSVKLVNSDKAVLVLKFGPNNNYEQAEVGRGII